MIINIQFADLDYINEFNEPSIVNYIYSKLLLDYNNKFKKYKVLILLVTKEKIENRCIKRGNDLYLDFYCNYDLIKATKNQIQMNKIFSDFILKSLILINEKYININPSILYEINDKIINFKYKFSLEHLFNSKIIEGKIIEAIVQINTISINHLNIFFVIKIDKTVVLNHFLLGTKADIVILYHIFNKIVFKKDLIILKDSFNVIEFQYNLKTKLFSKLEIGKPKFGLPPMLELIDIKYVPLIKAPAGSGV